MRTHRKPIIAVLVIAIMVSACGGSKELKQVAEAAKDIGGGTRDTIAAVGQAFDQGLLTLTQKDKLADLLIAIARGGQKGVAVIDALERSGVTNIPADKQKLLSAIFTEEVTAPFLQLLTELGKLTEAQSAAIRVALVTLRSAILLLSNRIGRVDIERAIMERSAYA